MKSKPKSNDTWKIEKGKEVTDISNTFDKLKRKMSGQKFKELVKKGWEIEKGEKPRINRMNKKFYEATKRLHARKKKIKQSQINDLMRKAELKKEFRKLTKRGVKYAKKKGIRTLNDVVRIIHEGRKK